MLRHRVKNYHVGDLARQYAKLDIEEDFFVNYGFLPRTIQSFDASAYTGHPMVDGASVAGTSGVGVCG